MKVVFRVDASNRMGTGHLIRCLTLAEALRDRGAETRFICRAHSGNLIGMLQRQAMPVIGLPASAQLSNVYSEDYAAWLGVTQIEDAEQSIEALQGDHVDVLIVDHYSLDIDWEQRLRPHTDKIMVIDDLVNRRHDCDLLLNQNYSAEREDRSRGLVPEICRLLLGPSYALLRQEYAAYRRVLRQRDGLVHRVLVFFGGPDPYNTTGLALEALSAPEFRHLEVDVVIGGTNPHRVAIEKQISMRPRTKLYGPRPHLADLMAQADLAIGAGGATTWERMCFGLPSLVISLSENQRPACEALAQEGLIYYLGEFSEVQASDLGCALKECIENREHQLACSIRNQLLADGLGTLRLAEVLDPTPTAQLRLRLACHDDMNLYFNWANDHEVRRQAIHSEPISWARHQEWFTNKLADAQSHLFTLMTGSLPVGQIRFDQEGDEARIDYSLDALVRGRGWATRLVAMGAAYLRQSAPITLRAKVKAGNYVSRSVFMRHGFKQAPLPLCGGGDMCRSIAIMSDRNSWLNAYLPELILNWLDEGHRVLWAHDIEDLLHADFCFYLSCGQIVPPSILKQYLHNLVVHESDLPRGKGWSPLTWQILEDKNRIPVTLLEAAERVDSGRVYAQEWLEFEGHELIDEMRERQAKATIKLCKLFVDGYPKILAEAREQIGAESFYPHRQPADSRLTPTQSIKAQFDLFRVVDNQHYPAFFDLNGQRYFLRIDKAPLPSGEENMPT